MAGQDSYGQGVSVAALTDAPDAATLAKNIADGIAQRSVMRFASASTRAATLTGSSAPVEGMVSWLQDTNTLQVYDGTAWYTVPVLGAVTLAAFVSSSYGVTSDVYTTNTVSGTYSDCAVTFTAPVSGKVLIHIAGRFQNTADANAGLLSAQVRIGGTVGSGSICEDADDSRAARSSSTTFYRVGITHLLSGLTAGQVYNARLLHKTSAITSTASFAHRELIIQPVT